VHQREDDRDRENLQSTADVAGTRVQTYLSLMLTIELSLRRPRIPAFGSEERERAVVVMTFYDEQTGADVASFLGVSEANVRVIRHRAIHQLRGCMGVAA
jgi:DNA-directed RNA polymerase specialized sigma24 family protein